MAKASAYKILQVADEDGRSRATISVTIQTSADPTPNHDEITVYIDIGGAAIPEPTSFGLVMTALLGGLGLFRRKRS